MSEQFTRIRAMAERLVWAQNEVKRLEGLLEAAKEVANRLEREDLPELMREVGLTSFSLNDGSKVDLIDDVACAITQENHEEAIGWLDSNGFGGLIKTQMQVTFNREDRSAAIYLSEKLVDAARQEKVQIDPVISDKVHPATLKSFIKEELGKGTAVPFDLFSIHPYSKVKIKPGKA